MPRMKPIRSAHTPARKLARLIASAWLMLGWIGAVLFTDNVRINRRHIHRRYSWLSLGKMARVISHLVVVRAKQLMHRVTAAPARDFTAGGFKRRIRRGARLRALIGARLRNALRHPNLARRYARLLHVLANLDLYARRMIRRLHRGMTRTRPILPVRPAHADARSVGEPRALALIDTS